MAARRQSKTEEQINVTGVPDEFKPRGLQVWKPLIAGEQLHGFYEGSSEIRQSAKASKGKRGQTFKGHRIKDAVTATIWTVSGAALDRQFDGVDEGTEVYVVFNGLKKAKVGQFKDFQVYTK